MSTIEEAIVKLDGIRVRRSKEENNEGVRDGRLMLSCCIVAPIVIVFEG